MTLPSFLNGETLFYGVVFLAVVLLLEGGFIWYQDTYGTRRRVSRRMAMVEKGATSEEIITALRRQSTDLSRSLLPSAIRYLDSRMNQAGVRISAQRMLSMMAGATLLIGILFPLIGGVSGSIKTVGSVVLLVMFAVGIGIVLPLMWLNWKAAARLKKIEAQFPVALDVLVRGLRAGYPVTGALELVVNEMPDPLASELGLVVAEMNYGYPLRDALENFAGRVQTQDANMFVVSVAIQTETGGSLADILDGLSKVIRDRAAMVLKVRALASEGKMTGAVLTAAPVLTFVSVFSADPNFYLSVTDDPMFMPAVLGVLFMYTLGIVIMRRLIAIKV
ncbi:type II secretion system F family protein [Sandarakinorhabdus rubra]|uniref:type II secretion system F family protein n=1 Tax=Sandarakinorhabdus rubra TaxID=2672568 RepID=UPI0013DA3038|nr:type II secretion system F family protein [Sandarakinorhabdus rubra]